MIEQRLENSGRAKLFSHINTLNPPEISVPPITLFIGDHKLPGDHWPAAAFYLRDEVGALGRIIQQGSDALTDALRVKPALLGVPGHAQVEFGNEWAVHNSGFSDFCVNVHIHSSSQYPSLLSSASRAAW